MFTLLAAANRYARAYVSGAYTFVHSLYNSVQAVYSIGSFLVHFCLFPFTLLSPAEVSHNTKREELVGLKAMNNFYNKVQHLTAQANIDQREKVNKNQQYN